MSSPYIDREFFPLTGTDWNLSAWEGDPDRWQTPPQEIPDGASELLNPAYHQHPIAVLTNWWDLYHAAAHPPIPGAPPTPEMGFSETFAWYLNQLHGVWAKDQHPLRIRVTTRNGVHTPRDIHPITWEPLTSLQETCLLAWTKVLWASQEVAKHLRSQSLMIEEDELELTGLAAYVAALEVAANLPPFQRPAEPLEQVPGENRNT